MVEAKGKLSSQWWWLDSQKKGTPNRSPWLQSTLSELDEKTEAMLRIVEQDADSFAQRAEMYYKKRPQLINMVEDFHRTHRLLAEKYDQIKCESGTTRLVTPWMSPLSLTKYYPHKKLMSATEISYDSYSEAFGPESESSDNISEVDDPDLEEEEEIQTPRSEKETMEVSSGFHVNNDEVVKLREEIEKLKEESRVQQELLAQKDEEKREVIRQLSLAMDMLREENIMLRKTVSVTKAASSPKKENIIELETLKEGFRKTSSPKKENNIELKTFKEGFWKRLFN